MTIQEGEPEVKPKSIITSSGVISITIENGKHYLIGTDHYNYKEIRDNLHTYSPGELICKIEPLTSLAVTLARHTSPGTVKTDGDVLYYNGIHIHSALVECMMLRISSHHPYPGEHIAAVLENITMENLVTIRSPQHADILCRFVAGDGDGIDITADGTLMGFTRHNTAQDIVPGLDEGEQSPYIVHNAQVGQAQAKVEVDPGDFVFVEGHTYTGARGIQTITVSRISEPKPQEV
jgi:hypothetical protein